VEKRTLNGERWKEKKYHLCVPLAIHLHLELSQCKSVLHEDTLAPFPSSLPAKEIPDSKKSRVMSETPGPSYTEKDKPFQLVGETFQQLPQDYMQAAK